MTCNKGKEKEKEKEKEQCSKGKEKEKGRCFRKTRRTVGYGLYIDEASGNTTFNVSIIFFKISQSYFILILLTIISNNIVAWHFY